MTQNLEIILRSVSFYLHAVGAIQGQSCLLIELSKEIHIITSPLENLRQDLTLTRCPHLDHSSFADLFAYLQMGNCASLWSGQSGGGCEECGKFVSPSWEGVFSERNCSTLHKGWWGPERSTNKKRSPVVAPTSGVSLGGPTSPESNEQGCL